MRPAIRRFLVSKLLLVPVGVLFLFAVTGFILAPLVVRWYVPKYTRDRLNCQASLGKVRINPFLLKFELKDFRLNGPDGGPLVGFSRLYLDCQITGFFHWALQFKEIRLEKPSVSLVVEPDGSLNLAALVPEPAEAKVETSKSRSLGLILGTVAMTGGEVILTDRRQVTPAVLSFQDLDLELKSLTTLADESGIYSLEAATRDGEAIAWEGQLSLAPFHSNGRIVCSRIRTASLWEFLQNIVNLERPQGSLTVSTDYQLSAAQAPLHLTLQNFRADLSGVTLQLPETEAPFFEMSRFEIDSARFDLASRELQISRLLVDGGVLHVGIDEAGRSNLDRMLRGRPAAETGEAPSAASESGGRPAPPGGPPWTVRVEGFEVKDMACDVEDLSRTSPVAGGVSNISIRSRAVIEVGVKARVELKEMVTEFKGAHLGVKAAPRPLFEAQRMFLEGGELDLGARTLSVMRIGMSEGHVDVGLDQQGRMNWERLLGGKTKGGDTTGPPAAAQPSPAEEAPWKVNLDAVDIKDMAIGLEDMSRSSPLAAGIAGISIDCNASVEAGRETQIEVKAVAAELKGLRLGVKGAAKPLFEAQRFVLEGGEADSGAKTLAIQRIALSEGHLDVGRDRDGTINWQQLLARKGDTPEQGEPGPDSGRPFPWKLLLRSFEMSKFRSEVMDRSTLAEKPLYQLRDLRVRASEIDGKSPMSFEAGFGLEQGGQVALRGKIDPASASVETNVNLAGVVLTPVQPYLEPFITLTLDSAAVSSDGVLRYGQPGEGPKLSYQGSFGIDKLSLSQPGSDEAYLGWEAMQAPQVKLTLEPNGLQIDEIKLTRPIGELIIAEDRSVNLAKIIKERPVAVGAEAPPESQPKPKTKPKRAASKGPKPKSPAPRQVAKPAAQPPGSGGPFPFSIGRVKIEDGNMVFADLSLKPKFTTRIHGLKGTVGKLSSEKRSLSEVQLDGRVDQYGMAKISGALDINDFKRSTDLTMVFRNVEMANISPYSGKFAGRRIKSGKLSMDLKYRIQDARLMGDNKIIVDNLVLGEKVDSPDSTNLPLDLAVALLSDANGRIDLGLPVSGELNDPKFSIGPILWKAIVNVITRAVTAPFRALGSLLGGGAEKFDVVEFEPGKAELLPPEKEKLKKLANALQKKPRLKLVVQGRFSPEIDGLALKQLSVTRAVAARMGVQPKPDEGPGPLDLGDSKVKGALEKLFEERFGSKALDEIERAVKKGEIKPRAAPEEAAADKGARKKPKGLAWLWRSARLYKIVPGAMSPEQSDLLAGELFARLVESDPEPEEALSQLAWGRAREITAELQKADAVPADRLQTADIEPLADEAGVSARLSLDTVSFGK